MKDERFRRFKCDGWGEECGDTPCYVSAVCKIVPKFCVFLDMIPANWVEVSKDGESGEIQDDDST